MKVTRLWKKKNKTLKSEKAKTTSKTSKGSLQDARDKSKNQGKKRQKPHPKPQKVVFRMQEITARTREKDVASKIKLTQSVA